MAITLMDRDSEDALFRVFNAAQDLERRILRMVARRHFNAHSVSELKSQVEGMLPELTALMERDDVSG